MVERDKLQLALFTELKSSWVKVRRRVTFPKTACVMDGTEQDSAEECVFLACVKEGGRLRVRITSPGYLHEANCQFSRAIREAGRVYRVAPSCIKLAAGARGKYFYRVNGTLR